jgi:hypothetical protein
MLLASNHISAHGIVIGIVMSLIALVLWSNHNVSSG